MPEKPLRGAGPTADAPQETAALGARGAEVGGAMDDSGRVRAQDGGPDSGGARGGRKVAAREPDSAPRVSLVPVAPDGTIDSLASTAETRRVDIGRTTLMGVPSPLAEREKPTSPGHDVHLPGDTERTVNTQRREQALPVATTGVIPAVEMDGSSTRRLDNIEPLRGQATKRARPEVKPTPVDRTAVDRTITGAAATFRAGQTGGARSDLPLEGRRNREPDRPPPPDADDEGRPNRFVTALVVGVSLSIGFGIVVQGFIRSRVRGAHNYEAMEVARPLPQIPPPADPEKLDTVPAPVKLDPVSPPPPGLDDPPPTPDPQTAAAVEPDRNDAPVPAAEPDAKPGGNFDRRGAARAKAGTPPGRPAPASRLNPMAQRPAAPAAVVPTAPATAFPSAPATTPATPTQPPPQSAAPKTDQPKTTYDPDLPMPPSAE